MPAIRMIHPEGGADVVYDDDAAALMMKAGWKREDGRECVKPDLPQQAAFRAPIFSAQMHEPPPIVRKRGPYRKRGRK